MKYNYFLVPSLPEIIPEGVQEFSMKEFVDSNSDVFSEYSSGVERIIFINEIKNIELVLKSKLDKIEGMSGNSGDEFNYFVPSISSVNEIERFIDDPVSNSPEDYPDNIIDYFIKYKDNNERYRKIEELFVGYFEPKDSDSDFFKYALNVMSVARTIIQVVRLNKKDFNIEEHIAGNEDIVRTILENRSSADFGLSTQFPFVSDIISAFEKDTIELEHELDKIIYYAIAEYGENDLFGDHVIYTFLFGLFLLDRWGTMDDEKGREFVENILSA